MSILENEWSSWNNTICSNATQEAKGANAIPANATLTFYAATNMRITYISATAKNNRNNTNPGSITVTVDNVLIQTVSITIASSERAMYGGAFDVLINAGQKVEITIKGSTGQTTSVFYDTNTDIIPWARDGLLNQSCPEMTIGLAYEPMWILDNWNNHYPHQEDVNITHFTYFETDDAGYPKNTGVWKLDNQNDGYPWMTGYTPISIRRLRNATYMVVNGALRKLRLYYQDDNSLSDAQLFKLKEIK